MGKGNRNRIGREESDVLTSRPAKTRKRRTRRPLPKLLFPIVALVLVVAFAVTAITIALVNNGTFKRNNVLIKSQKSGKYSINQQAAQVMIWTMEWDQASQIYQYYSGIANSEFEYCWGRATTAKYNINEYIGDYYAKTLVSLVASCDEGVRSGVTFTKEEEEQAYQSMLSSLKNEAYSYYSFLSSNGLSDVSPYYVYSAGSPYFGQFLKETLGKDIRETDIRRAAVIQAYANKVYVLKQNEYWETDRATAEAEVAKNPERYYTTSYLTYATEDSALAALLAGIHEEDEFRTAIAKDYVKNHYVALYNKYVTGKTATVNDTLTALRGKTTDEELTTALTEQGLTPATYAADDATLTAEQKEWLFAEGRAQFDAATVTSEDGLTASVIVVSALDSEANTVTAAIKTFTYDTLSEDELTKLTNTVLKELELPIADGAPVYELENDKADAFLEELKAEGADQAALMAGKGATDVADVKEDTETVPQAIRHAVFADGAETGTVKKVSSGSENKLYVIYVSSFTAAVAADPDNGVAEAPATANISYVEYVTAVDSMVGDLTDSLDSLLPEKSDAAFQKPAEVKAAETVKALNEAADKEDYLSDRGATFVSELTAENKADKGVHDEIAEAVLADGVAKGAVLTVNVPESTGKYIIYVTETAEAGVSFYYLTVSTFEAGSYQEWLFGNVDAATMTGAPAKGETFTVDPTESDKNYHVYLVVDDPLKMDEETVVRGGYLKFDSEESANEALAKLANLTGYKLLNTLADMDTGAVANNMIRESAVSGALKDWLFSAERKENEAAVVKETGEDGVTTIYVAAFVQSLPAWESSARSNYASESVNSWVEGVVETNGYKVSESALKKVKNPKAPKVAEETTETTATAAPVVNE